MAEVVSSDEFQEKVLEATDPVLIDFFAVWCGPCQSIAPMIDEIAEEYADRVSVYEVDIDKSPDLAARYSVSAVPTLALFEEGQLKRQIVGARPKQEILSLIG